MLKTRKADTSRSNEVQTESNRVIRNPRVEIIDVLRFIAAFWVMLDHAGQFPLVNALRKSDLLGLAVRGVYNNLFSGPAAVIIFFVISGYCIHRPYRVVRDLPLIHYFIRRFVRILLPMGAAVLIAVPAGVPLRLFNDTILWSLLAELIYYSLYPVLRVVARRIGWEFLILAAYGGWLILLILYPSAPSYASYGARLNWLMGLPCWLLGCLMAERDPTRAAGPSRFVIWLWRLAIWAFATGCSALHFHSPIRYSWTLNVFGIAVFFWLEREIEYHNKRSASRLLAWAGLWTYSLYLTHEVTFGFFRRFVGWPTNTRIGWTAATLAMLLCAYLFYLLVEKPGHLLARHLARSLDPKLIVKQNRI